MYNKDLSVGILGSGIVGRVLAAAFLNEGHKVMLATRDASKKELVQWKDEHPEAQVGSFAETASFGDLLVIAVDGSACEDMIRQADAANFEGKLVIDAANPIAKEAPENGVLKFFTNVNESLMERTQKMLPGAKLVKAFNSVGNTFMYKPQFKDGTPTMFICGNDESAKQTVKGILDAFGFETADMGKATAARAIEPLCMLWCIPGLLNNEWSHAFKLLKA